MILAAVAQFSFAQDSYWMMTYEIGIPQGDTKTFTGKTSFRGFGIEGRKFVDNNVTLGGGIHWNVFYEKKDKVTTDIDNVTLTGTHFNYINAFPFYVNASYYLNEGSYIRPYLGINVGGSYTIYRSDIGLYRVQKDPLKFAVAPEAGVMIQTYGGAGITVNCKYNYGLKTSETDPLTYLSVNVGLLWTY